MIVLPPFYPWVFNSEQVRVASLLFVLELLEFLFLFLLLLLLQPLPDLLSLVFLLRYLSLLLLQLLLQAAQLDLFFLLLYHLLHILLTLFAVDFEFANELLGFFEFCRILSDSRICYHQWFK